MPVIDLVQLVRSSIDRNKEIPAVLDAYGQFVDSPIGPLELQQLDEVFARISDNLAQRFPDIAAKRAAITVRNDILAFLNATNNDPDRVKVVLRSELASAKNTMVVSISERFSRMNNEERRAIDATLRLIRRSSFEILFRADMGKQLATSGREFERFFAGVKAESPTIRELRYENLIVEKAIFNKLFLRAKDRKYYIWVPSIFVRENTTALIDRVALPNQHIMLDRLRQLAAQSGLDPLKPFLEALKENLGVNGKNESIPGEFADLVVPVGEYVILPPIYLDDVFSFLEEEQEKKQRLLAEEAQKTRALEEERKEEQLKKSEQFRQRLRPVAQQVITGSQQKQAATLSSDALYLGKELDFGQLASAINRRVPEVELPGQVREVGNFYLEISNRKAHVAIVGSSGSGRSATAKRIIDGIGQRKDDSTRVIVIDPKGEHRGIAWKYGWKVLSFAADSQAQEFRVPVFAGLDREMAASFGAELIQEWCNQGPFNCTDQQRERIASIIRAQPPENLNLATIANLIAAEPELADLGQRLKKNLTTKGTFSRMFSEAGGIEANLPRESVIIDISGRGLRDPTSKEERLMISVILLRDLLGAGIKDSIIVLEDTLDRFKSESLKARTKGIIDKLRANGNYFIATARSNLREFLGGEDSIEIVHRLSGEKIINEEFSQFNSNIPVQSLQRIVGFLPRGYAINSRYIGSDGQTKPTSAFRVEILKFEST